MLRKIAAALLVGFLVGSLLMTVAVVLAGDFGTVRGESRDRTPVLSVKDFNLETLVGKVVLIGFWQTLQCEACQTYIPWLTEMQARYGEDGLVIVAVNQDRDEAAATVLLSKIHPRTQVVLDPTGKMGSSYKLEGMPSTYLYDRNLNMREKFVGFVLEETDSLETTIVNLLEQEYKD
jgi:thiol-disulfide isomerase/thioredoxin